MKNILLSIVQCVLVWVFGLFLVVHAAPVECDKISKYTTPFFKSVSRAPTKINNTCVFYTAQQTLNARRYTGLTVAFTIWDMYPCPLYNIKRNDPANPLRCIMGDPNQQRTYFENMSRAFAQNCGGRVFVMTPATKRSEIPRDGIWGRVEQPALQAEGSGCNMIVAIDPTGKPQFTVWRRDGSTDVDVVAEAEASNLSLLERRDNVQTCYPNEEIAAVDEVVNW